MQLKKHFIPVCLFAFCLVALSYCAPPPKGVLNEACQKTEDCNQDDGLECRNKKCRKKATNEKPRAAVKIRSVQGDFQVASELQLDGTRSSDVDEDLLTYKWTVVKKPEGSKAEIKKATQSTASFTPDKQGEYTFQLIVNDGKLDSAPARESIVIDPRPNNKPIADAGKDQVVGPSGTVKLDGSESSDPDNDKITYLWSIKSQPVGSKATLSDPKADKPTFVAKVEGRYVIELVVEDEFGLKSEPDSLTVQAMQGHDKIPVVSSISPKDSYSSLKLRATVTGKLFFDGAKVRLENDRQSKTFTAKYKSETSLEVILDLGTLDAGDFNVIVINPNTLESKDKVSFKVKPLPSPKLKLLNPAIAYTGVKKVVIKATGEFFLKGQTAVLFETTPLSTRVLSETSLEFDLDVSQTTPGTYNVRIRNPGNRLSDPMKFTVLDKPPKPVLRVLNPPFGKEKTQLAFSVHGIGFAEGAVIMLNGKPLKSKRIRRDEMRADPVLDLKALALAPGSYDVWVKNPDGQETNKEKFRVVSVDPKPSLDRILPFALYLGEEIKPVSIYGQDIQKGAKFFIGTTEITGKYGSVRWRSTTYLEATVDLRDKSLWKIGTYDAYVVNPNKKKSNVFKLTVSYRVPSLNSVTPGSWTTKCDTTLELSGINFVKSTKAYFGTTEFSTSSKTNVLTFVDGKTLRFPLKATKLTTGNYDIYVTNGPSATSSKYKFTIESGAAGTPLIDYALPAYGQADTKVSVTVRPPFSPSTAYRSIKPGAVIEIGGKKMPTVCQRSLNYCYSLGAQLDLTGFKPGIYKLYIVNPCDVRSAPISFSVEAPPRPLITGFVPGFAETGDKKKIVIKGQNFNKVHELLWNGKKIKSTFKSTKEIETTDAIAFSQLGKNKVEIKHANGMVSNPASFDVLSPFVPKINEVSGNVQQKADVLGAITLKGSGFLVTSIVYINGAATPTRFVNSKELYVQSINGKTLKEGVHTIQVKNGKRASNTVPLILLAPPGPRINYIRPSAMIEGAQATIANMYISGTLFQTTPQTKVVITGPKGKDFSALWTTTRSYSFAIYGTFKPGNLPSGTYVFQAKNGNGGLSNKVFFTISPPPPPTATGVSPSSVYRGVKQPVQILGNNFSPLKDVVIFNNNILQKLIPDKKSSSGTSLRIDLDLSTIRYGGKYPLYVQRGALKTKVVYLTIQEPPCGKNPSGGINCATIMKPAGSEACDTKKPAAQQVCRPTCKTNADCTKLGGSTSSSACKSGFCY